MQFCGLKQRSGDAPSFRHQRPNGTFFVTSALPGFDLAPLIIAAAARWSAVANVSLTLARSPNDCDLLVEVHNLGGRGGVLADCELPANGYRPQKMRIDINETWGVFDGPEGPTRRETDLVRVLCHELGHYWGLEHFDPNPPAELMEPTYSQQVIGPQMAESRFMRNWYGPPKQTPVTPVPLPGGSSGGVILTVEGGSIPPGRYKLG
jgi:hypothetical protein